MNFINGCRRFLKAAPKGFRYGIETRNQNYLNTPYFELLNGLGLYHVFLQGYWMPSIFDVYGRFKAYIKDATVICLLGPDRKNIEQKTRKKWNSIVDPRDGELKKLKKMISSLMEKQIQVSVNVNNHYEGSAPMTIKRFVDMYLGDCF